MDAEPSTRAQTCRRRPWTVLRAPFLAAADRTISFVRRTLRALSVRWRRCLHHEFWPPWIFYLPVIPYCLYLSVRHRHLLAFTCCNPGILPWGGLVGESKLQILTSLREAAPNVLPAWLIPPMPSPADRAAAALAVMAANPPVSSFPIILKPDDGFRGFAVRLIRNSAEMADYFASMTGAALLQAYHPGPQECGILWVRRDIPPRPGSRGDAPPSSPAGDIFAVTRKQFPVVIGDGRSTIQQLILAHPRYSLQSGVFLARFAGRADEVPAPGLAIRLAEAGNHCQGTLFRDGADLVTPHLAAAIDRIADSFTAPDGSPHALDFGRFDLRYTSDDDLRAGRSIAIIELNGVTSEATNIYDPDRSLFWAYRVLFRQWAHLYRLGALRRARGVRPARPAEVIRALRRHYAARTGSALAD